MTHTFGNAGFRSLLLLSYHCCVSVQTFGLALQNTLWVVQRFCCPPHLSVPWRGKGCSQVGRRTRFPPRMTADGKSHHVLKKSVLLYIFLLQDQFFSPHGDFTNEERSLQT